MADAPLLPDVNRDYGGALGAFTDWYVHEATALTSPRALVRDTCLRFVAHGVALQRFTAFMLTLHPDHFGVAHRWVRGRKEITTGRGNYAVWDGPMVRDSPYGLIRDGAAAVRCRLTGPDARLDYEVLRDYAGTGATDYVIMHLPFIDRARHAAAFVGDRPEGFTPAELRFFDAMLPHMARQSELLTLRFLTTTLLDTYVGRQAGERVLTGQIRRGSGETLRAVIWLSDLRGFTRLSDTLPRETLIGLLNAYFDCVGGPIAAAGGEILKFIGDAVLAIFPLDDGADERQTCAAALAAAAQARSGLAALRALPGADALDFGIALHIGDVMYGNIGTASRLDFTVIGPAVNLTARLEALAPVLGTPVVMSAAVAAIVGGGVSLGRHRVKGVAAPVEVFRPAGGA